MECFFMTEPTTNRHTIAQKKYDKAHTVGVYVKLNRETDKDIIAWLEKQDNKQGTIKRILREAINKEN